MSTPTQSRAYVLVTKPGQTVLVDSPRNDTWIRATFTLETTGPAVAGFDANLLPITAGKGRTLFPGRAVFFEIAPGQRIYIATDNIERVSIGLESIPWDEEMTDILRRMAHEPAGQLPGGTGPGRPMIGNFGFKAPMPGEPKK